MSEHVDEQDVEALRKIAPTLDEEDFSPARYGNLDLDAIDFKGLVKEGAGAEVLLVVKGRVQTISAAYSGESGPCSAAMSGAGNRGSLTIRISEAALVRGKLPKLGTGDRFSRLKAVLSARDGVRNPGALAAEIGRRKFGKSSFQK